MTICLKTGSDFSTLAKPFALDRWNRGEWAVLWLVFSRRELIAGLNFRANFAVIHQAACFFNGK